jgi:hypothetical protein
LSKSEAATVVDLYSDCVGLFRDNCIALPNRYAAENRISPGVCGPADRCVVDHEAGALLERSLRAPNNALDSDVLIEL